MKNLRSPKKTKETFQKPFKKLKETLFKKEKLENKPKETLEKKYPGKRPHTVWGE